MHKLARPGRSRAIEYVQGVGGHRFDGAVVVGMAAYLRMQSRCDTMMMIAACYC